MSMSWRKAKEWAQKDREKRDWRTQWKYGNIVKAVGIGRDGLVFQWGSDATPEIKKLLQENIKDITKWADKVEKILGKIKKDKIQFKT